MSLLAAPHGIRPSQAIEFRSVSANYAGAPGAADSIFGRVSKVALGYPKASGAPPLKKNENS